MREQKYQNEDKKYKEKPLEVLTEMPIVISIRTGLAGKDESLINKVHSDDLADFPNRTVKYALDYIINTELSDKELAMAESIKKELNGRDSVVVVNGKNAKLSNKLDEYLVVKEHQLPDGTIKQYRELEIEISAVQQGGYNRFHRY